MRSTQTMYKTWTSSFANERSKDGDIFFEQFALPLDIPFLVYDHKLAAFHKWLLALLVWCLRSPRLLFLLLCISSPLPLLVVAEERCALGLVELQIRYRSCVPKTVMALACRGSCYSYSQPDRNRPYQMERSCRCCRELGSQSGRTRMRCPNRNDPTTSKVYAVSFRLPRRCACRPCSQ